MHILIHLMLLCKYVESLDFDLEFLVFWALCCDGGCKSCNDKSVESNTYDHPNYGDENLLGIICAEITVANSRKSLKGPIQT